ncbi:MAG: polynucleotide adenylyltransferase PcnB [Kiritimatiellia bacterium]|jgi:poly(A) polymerase
MMSFLSRKKIDQKIPIKAIDPDAVAVLRRLNKAGYTAYLVGGGVRDLLLGRTPKDFDIATDARPNQIRRLFRNAFIIGRRFRLALIRFGDKQIETATFRRSPVPDEIDSADVGTPGALYQSEDNAFGTPEEDAMRRDFTVNALFYDITDGKVIDYVGGLRDLAKKTLRSIGDPNIRFREDPVRMLRAVRLSTRLDFTIHSDSAKAITRHCGEIMQASKPRLFEEIVRLFNFGNSESAFQSLWRSKLMAELLPAIADYIARSGKAKSPLWKHLAALDAAEPQLVVDDRRDPHYVYETPLRLAVLLAPLFLERCKDEGAKGADHAREVAETLLDEVLVAPFSTPSWRIPRLMCQDTVNILRSLSFHFDANIRRNRYFRQPWFHTALVFWRLHAMATDNKTALPVIDSWSAAYEQFIVSNAGRRQKKGKRADGDAKDEGEDEDSQRDNLFPERKNKRRRSRRSRRAPKSSGDAAAQS